MTPNEIAELTSTEGLDTQSDKLDWLAYHSRHSVEWTYGETRGQYFSWHITDGFKHGADYRITHQKPRVGIVGRMYVDGRKYQAYEDTPEVRQALDKAGLL